MVRAILHGCNGAMGQVISQLAAEDPELEIVAGVDLNTDAKNGYPVFASLEACSVEADVVIDFSTAKAMDSLLEALAAKKLPAVICTTGLTPEQLQKVEEVSGQVALLRSANMSVGINLVFKVLEMMTPIPVSYTHLDVYKRQPLLRLCYWGEEPPDPLQR